MTVNYIQNINDFKNLILVNTNVIVNFYSEWCGPCKMITPIFEKISKNKKDITFIKININKSLDITKEYNILSVPTLIYYKNSKEIARNVGFLSEEQINTFLNEHY